MAKNARSKKTAKQTLTMHDAFLMELKDMYDAEQQILKALPKMIKKAQNEELRSGFERHEQETQDQVKRLEEVFASLDEMPKKKRCMGIQGILEEGEELMKQKLEPSAMDAALAAAAQKVEHYEISAYGTLCSWAKTMGHMEALDFLLENLNEEKETDQILTTLSESRLNRDAMESGNKMGMHESAEDREKMMAA